MNSVAIIGGGITGLTTAFRLKQAGVPVELYEAGPRVGGVLRTVCQDGFLAEFGPNAIMETSPLITSLVEDLGLSERKVYSADTAKKRFIVRNGRLEELPVTPRAFLFSKLFTLSAKLRLIAEPFIRRGKPEVEETLAQFVERRLGREFLDYAINPFVAGVYAGDPAELSVSEAFPKLFALEQKYGSLIKGQIQGAKERRQRGEVSKQSARMFSFDRGMQTLTEALHSSLAGSVHLNARVDRIGTTGRGYTVVANGSAQYHSAVLLTAPAHRLSEIDAPFDSTPFHDVHYPPVSSLVLGFRRELIPHPLNGFGMLIPEVEKFHILGTLFSSSLFSNRAPMDCVTLTNYIGGTRQPALPYLDDQELVRVTMEDLRKLLHVSGDPIFVHKVLYDHAIPQYRCGYGTFKRWLNDVELKLPGVFFAGNYRDGISVGDSITSAHKAADKIKDFFTAAAAVQVPAHV